MTTNWRTANREVYMQFNEGIEVSMADTDSTPHPGPGGGGGGTLGTARLTKGGGGTGGQTTVRMRVMDWEQSANNDILQVSQFSVTGALHTC